MVTLPPFAGANDWAENPVFGKRRDRSAVLRDIDKLLQDTNKLESMDVAGVVRELNKLLQDMKTLERMDVDPTTQILIRQAMRIIQRLKRRSAVK